MPTSIGHWQSRELRNSLFSKMRFRVSQIALNDFTPPPTICNSENYVGERAKTRLKISTYFSPLLTYRLSEDNDFLLYLH